MRLNNSGFPPSALRNRMAFKADEKANEQPCVPESGMDHLILAGATNTNPPETKRNSDIVIYCDPHITIQPKIILKDSDSFKGLEYRQNHAALAQQAVQFNDLDYTNQQAALQHNEIGNAKAEYNDLDYNNLQNQQAVQVNDIDNNEYIIPVRVSPSNSPNAAAAS